MDYLDDYKRMYNFLSKCYFEFQIDDLGVILGGMTLLEDQKPIDSAALKDWKDTYSSNPSSSIEHNYLRCIDLIKLYSKQLMSIELKEFAGQMENDLNSNDKKSLWKLFETLNKEINFLTNKIQ